MKMLVVFVFALTVCSISADPILPLPDTIPILPDEPDGPDGIGGIGVPLGPGIPGGVFGVIVDLLADLLDLISKLLVSLGVPTDKITNITGLLLNPDLTKKLTCALLGYLERIRAAIGIQTDEEDKDSVEDEEDLKDLVEELKFVISKVSKILDLLPRNEVLEPIRKAIKEIDNILRETTGTIGEVLKRVQDVIAGLQTSLGGTLDCPKLGIGGINIRGLLNLISKLTSKLIGLGKPISKLLGSKLLGGRGEGV